MDFTNAAWLQQPQIPELHPTPDSQHPASDDWKEPSTSTQSGTGAASGQPSLDLSEFAFGDLSAPSSSASSITSSAPPIFHFSSHSFYVPTTPGPYNAVAYGSTPWSTASNQVPLSSYSSLNGATSTSSNSSQPSPPPSATMMIDPALTTMNGSASPPVHQYQHSPPFLSSQPQQRTQYQYQHQSHPTLSINPSYVHTTPSHFHQSAIPFTRPGSQQQQQGTLSPYVLHSPTNNLASSLPPSSFYGNYIPHPPAPTVTPEQKKANFLTAIRPLLSPTSFTGAGAVSQLAGNIDDYGMQDVDPATKFEILTKIRDNAGNHYFRAWVENEVAMEVTREWLKLAYAGKNDPQLVETIMPLLHIIDRLPLTIETLKSSKLGKIVVKLVKEPPAPAIKDMASNLERKWRQILASSSEDSSKRMDTDGPDDAKGKKRKAEPPASKSGPPAKKAAQFTAGPSSSKSVTVKKEAKSVVREVKDAKSDSSFFSAPKPKPKLPSFKKAPPAPVKKEPDMNVAQPSSINPFEEALKSMAKSRKDSPAMSTPPPAPAASSTPVPTGFTSSGKRKKSVTWAPEGKLEMIKLIERAIYDDDPADGMHTTHNIRDLDRDEGAALHAHLFEEQIEWLEPIPVGIPEDIDLPPRGEESTEKDTQEEREQAALVALYTTPAQIPESPAEPPSQMPEEQVDENVKLMLTGPEVDMVFWSDGAPAAVEPPSSSVAELVGQLAAGANDVQMADATHVGQQPFDFKAFGVDPSAPPQFSNLSSQQLQQLMQHAQALTQGHVFGSAPAAGQPAAGADQNWTAAQHAELERNGYYEEGGRDHRWSEEGGGWNDRGSSRGRYRGGRGRGRGEGFRSNKRKPCSFFAAGRCRYGDQCDFSHEPVY